jgi:hypothetical protein
MYFLEPDKDYYEEELQEYLNGEVKCRHCLEQVENPNSRDGFNDMSVNEYKEWFENKVK